MELLESVAILITYYVYNKLPSIFTGLLFHQTSISMKPPLPKKAI